MGGSTSVPVTSEIIENVCKYQKNDFNNKIEVLRDSHVLMQYYANVLLGEKMPMTLPEYKNYNATSESHFNTKRKEEMSDLMSINPKLEIITISIMG